MTRPGTRRADIQGMRAVAVLLVVAFHGGLDIPGGFTGVDVFFVISGFVITAMLLRELEGDTGRLSFASFYSRRVRRILPALALTVVVVALVSLLAVNPRLQARTAHTGIATAVFGANVYLSRLANGYFDVAPTLNPLLNMWSLSVEEQFYLVFPAFLLGAFFVARRALPRMQPRRIVGGLVGIAAVASFLLCLDATRGSYSVGPATLNSQFAFYMAPARAWEFAAGALLALAAPRLARLPHAGAMALGAVGALLVALAAFTITGTTPFPGTAALIPVLGTCLLLVAGTATTRGVSSLLGVRPLTWVGDLSYSWYLWHWPIIVFAGALWPVSGSAPLIAAVFSLLPAWLAYRWVENPIRLRTSIRGRRAVWVAAICIAAPIAACLLVLRAPAPPRSAATRAFLTASARNHADRVRGCNHGIRVGSQPIQCTWAVPHATGTVVLLGDSNAGQFVEPAARAANALGENLTVATMPNCPFVDLVVSRAVGNPRASGHCRSFVTGSLQDLIARRPTKVLLAASAPLYLTSKTTFRDPGTGQLASTPAAKAALWEAGLRRVLQQLSAAHIPTVVIHTVPQWATWDSRRCAAIRVYFAPRTCGATQSKASVARFRQRALAAENRAVRAAPPAAAADFAPVLCTSTSCSTNDGDRWLYRDGRHLSVSGALGLTPEFTRLLSAGARPT